MITAEFRVQRPADISNHLKLVACHERGYRDAADAAATWHCGYFYDGPMTKEGDMPEAYTCAELNDYSLYFDSGTDARKEALSFPEGVGVPIGAGTPFASLVLAVHYPSKDQLENGWTGSSGIDVTMTTRKLVKSAGFLHVYNWGYIGAHSVGEIEGFFRLTQPIRMHILKIVSHTHALGQESSVWKWSKARGQRSLLFSADPAVDHYYKDVPSNSFLDDGDKLLFRCRIRNDDDHDLLVK